MAHTGGLGPELPYLETFWTVCAEGGFSAAARKLGCSQPAVSYQIRRLEQVLGASLLERDGGRVVLTTEGRRFRSFADQVLVDLARVRNECLGGSGVEPLRLGSASGFGRYVLVPALHALRREIEDQPLDIRLQYEAADVLLDNLEAGEYEAAFVYKRKISSALRYESVYDEELVLVAGPRHSAEIRARDMTDVETFADVPFVTYEECDYVFGRWFDTSFGAQPSRLFSRSHFTELEEVIDFVSGDVGLSVVPLDAARQAHGRGEMEILYAGSRHPCLNQVFLVTRSGSEVRPTLRRLVELLPIVMDARDGSDAVSD